MTSAPALPAPSPGNTHDVPEHAPFERMAILRLVVAVLGAAAVWFRLYEPDPTISLIGAGALIFSGWPVFHEAARNLLARRMTMELSMAIAILAAAGIAEWFTALVITFFVLMAEELEHLTIARGRIAIRDLVEFIPSVARVRRAGVILDVPLEDVGAGETVLVNPGEKIPVDGRVTAGLSHVDQSRITGESMPANRQPGDVVFAGSINLMGTLEIEVERVGPDTSYGQIIQAVEAAEHTRAPVQKMADQLAGYLVYVAFGAAILTWLITRDIHDTISVIIVAGACGVAAGTPLAILGGIGRAAQLGSIIKGGIHLETLGRVNTVVLDKTGTLTEGEPRMVAMHPAEGVSGLDLLRLAAGVEHRSEHPLARAVMQEAEKAGIAIPPTGPLRPVIGRGVIAEVEGMEVMVGSRKLLIENGISTPPRDPAHFGSDIVIAADGRYLGEILVADPIRQEAREAIRALKALGIRSMLMSGDTRSVVSHVAGELGIDEAISDMLPEDKLARVRGLAGEGRVVAMVGDGVNDAPALTVADIGIAMGSGADVTQESADILLIGNNLQKLVETLRIARKTRRIIWQNFAGTIGVDTIGIGLAAFGFLNPLIAAFIHVGSELAFLLNSARLLARDKKA